MRALATPAPPLACRLVALLGGRLHYLLATATAAVSPILLGPAQVHFIGLSGYGQIVTVVLLAGMIASIANLGLSNSIVAKSANMNDPVQYVGSLMLKSALPSLGIAALFLAAASTVTWMFPGLSMGGFPSVAAGVCAGFALSQSRLWLEGLRAAGKSVEYLALSSTVVLICPLIATLSLYLESSPSTYLVAWSFMLSLLVAGKMIRLGWLARKSTNDHSIRLAELIRFGSPLTLHTLVGTALAFSDRIAIAAYISTAGVGQYQLASLAGLASVLICNGLNLWWLPRVISEPRPTRHRALARMLGETTAVVLIYSAILASGLAAFVDFVVSDDTQKSIVVRVGLLLGVAALSQPLYLAGTNCLYAAGRTGGLATRSIAANIGQGVGIWMVTDQYGLYGAALVVVIAQWIQAISVGISLFRESDERKNLAISMFPTLLGVALLSWASSAPSAGSGMVTVQVSLLAVSILAMIRYIRHGAENQ